MIYKNIKETMDQLVESREEGSISSRLVDVAEEVIRNSCSWEKKTVVESISDYLLDRFKDETLDFRDLNSKQQLVAVKIMHSPEDYTEEALMGATPRLGMEFIFPYHLFPKGSSVAIYGGGNVGRVICRQARKDGYVRIVGVFDQNLAGTAMDDMVVRPVREISNVNYDYILITIRDEKIATVIKNKLVSMNIPENIIRWDGDTYHRDNFFKNFYLPLVGGWNGSRDSYKRFCSDYNALVEEGVFDHVFPYHLFHEGEKVVIYGAGNIGKKFWKQGMKDKFVKIVGIVDRNHSDVKSEVIPVRPVKDIESMSFDSVLVSVHGPKNVIAEIRETLESMGIEDRKIKWDGRTYHQNEFRRNVYLNMLRAIGSDFETSSQMLGTLCRRIDTGFYNHVFPYRFFSKGERIIIWGAGEIGQNLFSQARRYGYVDVLAIVDENFDEYNDLKIPVLPIDDINKSNPDAVLIALDKQKDADVAREKLINIGIEEKNIFWNPNGYKRDAEILLYLKELEKRTVEELKTERLEGQMCELKDEWEENND